MTPYIVVCLDQVAAAMARIVLRKPAICLHISEVDPAQRHSHIINTSMDKVAPPIRAKGSIKVESTAIGQWISPSICIPSKSGAAASVMPTIDTYIQAHVSPSRDLGHTSYAQVHKRSAVEALKNVK